MMLLNRSLSKWGSFIISPKGRGIFRNNTKTSLRLPLVSSFAFSKPASCCLLPSNLSARSFCSPSDSKGEKSSTEKVDSPSSMSSSDLNSERLDPEVVSVVEEIYKKNHSPIGFGAHVGPPFTDTAKLEHLPEKVYNIHVPSKGFSDLLAIGLVKFFKIFTRLFFRQKYAHHAVVLETVAAVPGMVAGMLRHLRSLRTMQRDFGWIGTLLEEAENERMHLLTWMQLVQPTFLERIVVIFAQGFYTPFYLLIYVFSPKTAHRFVGYLEETAVEEYTAFLKAIDRSQIDNVPAPEIAKRYWNLAPNATLRDVVLVVRADECLHRNVNHILSKKCREGLH